uniref:Uncharacterized protein n=1 Tax=Candidatus Kentrum sp. MB TaxID=2138164 RepID=A0A451B717_9GAMM|nr:MAG: hypothetical protein BECKMB1821G_GA0114241_100215 [Candidatus Kentron sp. MB]VFK28768.1 MAG: hypothetical protein BECKMB1821I_GA0114274_100716 [Candidatus Kentron sp. MB]VFK74085.1 MAG: hypothetical protein BECKMB1821H_GA0114242_100115 [Candidatus Kentron sp. MB]
MARLSVSENQGIGPTLRRAARRGWRDGLWAQSSTWPNGNDAVAPWTIPFTMGGTIREFDSRIQPGMDFRAMVLEKAMRLLIVRVARFGLWLMRFRIVIAAVSDCDRGGW